MPVRESVGEHHFSTVKHKTCRRRVPVVVGLCVDHQAEAIAVPTCAVRPFDYLGAGSSEGVEVNLSENSYISCTR